MQRGSRLGPYEILGPLGAGGMGEVYRARDPRLGRDVAIKVLPAGFAADPERLRRFEQEAHAVAALSHPNILAIYDVGTHEGAPYLVTELLEGESLRERLKGGAMPVRKGVETAVRIAQGLAAAHEKGIVHRDVKPENVFVTNDGHVKILDFGIAKLAPPRTAEDLAKATTVVEATEAGVVLGTVAYMSPEQVRGQNVDPRSDIFSFGCVLYEMLSGRRAFVGESAADTMSAILHEEPRDFESTSLGFPGPVRHVVRRCLEKSPEDRFSSAHDLAFALEAAATDTSLPAAMPRVAARRVGRRWLAPAVVVVAAVAIGGLWVARHRGPAPLPQFHPRRIPGQLVGVSEPALSPSGSEIAYTAGHGGTSDIWVTDIRGGKPIRLTERSTLSFGPTWFPDGSAVAFSSDEGKEVSVWKVPRFGGTAMLLVPNAQDAAVSPAGKQIAFARPQKDGALRIWVAPLGAPDLARQATGENAGLWDHRRPAWSPDGKTICYQDAKDLWLVPAEGGAARRLTHDDAADQHPLWSADGRYIYFVSRRGGTQSLWRKAIAEGAPTRVTQGTSVEDSPTMSRDGRRVAFLSGLDTWAVVLVDMQTGTVNRLEEGRHTAYPAIAPDLGSIVFASDLAGSWDLWSLALRENKAVGEPARLTDHPGDCALPTFSPDGRWIAYFRVIEGQRDVWVIPSHGGTPVNFTSQPGVNVQPAWSPDGREIAFVSNRSGWHQVWAAPFAAGHRAGEARRITSEEADASSPCWSPDGKAIAYTLSTDRGSDVRIAPSDGSGVTRPLTFGAKVFYVHSCWARNAWAVSGLWGERLPSIRLLPAAGGEATLILLPAHMVPDLEYPDFDISRDGTLLAVFQRARQEEIWVLEVEEGSF
ncbi:MAG: protein kinase [Thermoanaerobaculales bacterium]